MEQDNSQRQIHLPRFFKSLTLNSQHEDLFFLEGIIHRDQLRPDGEQWNNFARKTQTYLENDDERASPLLSSLIDISKPLYNNILRRHGIDLGSALVDDIAHGFRLEAYRSVERYDHDHPTANFIAQYTMRIKNSIKDTLRAIASDNGVNLRKEGLTYEESLEQLNTDHPLAKFSFMGAGTVSLSSLEDAAHGKSDIDYNRHAASSMASQAVIDGEPSDGAAIRNLLGAAGLSTAETVALLTAIGLEEYASGEADELIKYYLALHRDKGEQQYNAVDSGLQTTIAEHESVIQSAVAHRKRNAIKKLRSILTEDGMVPTHIPDKFSDKNKVSREERDRNRAEANDILDCIKKVDPEAFKILQIKLRFGKYRTREAPTIEDIARKMELTEEAAQLQLDEAIRLFKQVAAQPLDLRIVVNESALLRKIKSPTARSAKFLFDNKKAQALLTSCFTAAERSLTEFDYSIFRMRFSDNGQVQHRVKEIAETLHTTVDTVKSSLYVSYQRIPEEIERIKKQDELGPSCKDMVLLQKLGIIESNTDKYLLEEPNVLNALKFIQQLKQYLHPKHQEILDLKYDQYGRQLMYDKEIAQQLDLTTPQVSGVVQNAIKRLGRLMEATTYSPHAGVINSEQ